MKPAIFAAFMLAATASAGQQVVLLWPGNAPGSESWTWKEIEYTNQRGDRYVRNVVHPSLTVFPADRSTANGTAIIIAPGGGFRYLSWDNEGTRVAEWLNAHGVTAFVLKYRVNQTPADPEEFQRQNAAAAAGRGRSAGSTPNHSGDTGQDARTLAVDDGKQAVRLVRERAKEWGVVCWFSVKWRAGVPC